MVKPPAALGRISGRRGPKGRPDPRADPQRILSARRALTCLVIGLVPGVVVAITSAPALFPLVSWVVASASALGWVWHISWPQDDVGTKRLAEAEGRSHSTDVWVLTAAVASLAAVVAALIRSHGRQDAAAIALVTMSAAAAVLSWALVNTVFALKYARLYYIDEPDMRGIEFEENHLPSYADFAYVAFTIGMTYAISDTVVTQARVRRVVLGHALLSYIFGTGILAIAIGLVTNIV